MKYWIGYAFVLCGCLLLVLPGFTTTLRWVGLAALLVGGCIGRLVRRDRMARIAAPDVSCDAPASKTLVRWSMLWMAAVVAVVVATIALDIFGNFSDTTQSLITTGGIVAVVGVPTLVLLTRYGRGR